MLSLVLSQFEPRVLLKKCYQDYNHLYLFHCKDFLAINVNYHLGYAIIIIFAASIKKVSILFYICSLFFLRLRLSDHGQIECLSCTVSMYYSTHPKQSTPLKSFKFYSLAVTESILCQ